MLSNENYECGFFLHIEFDI